MSSPDTWSSEQLQSVVDNKTKPPGSLGRLEELGVQIAALQQTPSPRMHRCSLTIFAADHGIAASGVSAYPQAVTAQMVHNFLSGGAAANVFANTLGIQVTVVDAGVAGEAIAHPGLVSRRVAAGTANSATEPAMTGAQCADAMAAGREFGDRNDVDAQCFGEMGIGNTSAATLVLHKLLSMPLADIVGRGTGLDDAGLANKLDVLERAASRTGNALAPVDLLAEYGGFEMAMMAGAMLQATARGTLVIVDGFIATAAAAVVLSIEPSAKRAMVFAHQSAEHGHRAALDALSVRPLLDLGLRLGEGTGALLAWPLVQAAAAMMSDMASFDSAGISGPS
ncbi:MAG: nicotinate-nucleotide--dimethylbenzimidazole phosphoribosyltransferase [Pseudomonadota bacterium]